MEKQDSVIHNMMVSVQCAIDLGNSIIEKKGLGIPSSYAEIFEILGRRGIISRSLSKDMSHLARFRNVLAHLYWDLDLKRAYRVLKTKDTVLRRFHKAVKDILR